MAVAPRDRPSVERSTGVMVAGTMLSRLTGFGRNVALAYAIGQNRLTDAYNVANTTPNIVYELILGGVLSASLVPLFVAHLRKVDDGTTGEADPWREISAVFTLVVTVAVLTSLAFVMAAPWIIDLYLSDSATADQRSIATTLLRLFGPQVVFYGLITVTTAVLEARRRFAAPKFAPVTNNIVVIATILALPHVARDLDVSQFRGDSGGLLLLGLGTTAGVAAMAVAQVVRLGAAGARLRPVWAPGSPMVRRLIRLSGWTVGVVATNQVALWITINLATGAEGAQTAYTNAYIFFLLPHGVYAVSVASAMAPEMAEHWALGDIAGLGRRVVDGLRRTLAVLAPAAVGLAVTAGPLVTAVLQHGRFGADDARTTATTLACFALGLPGFSAFLFLGRVWQSMQETRTMFFLYVLENGLNIVLALVLYGRFGVQGLAASYSIAYTAAALVSLAVLRRRLPGSWTSGLSGWTVRLALVTGAVAASAAGTVVALDAGLAPGAARAVIQLACATVVGAGALVLVAPWLGVPEPGLLISPILRRLGLARLLPDRTAP